MTSEQKDTYPMPAHGWTCFHCGDHFPGDFAGSQLAKRHFGAAVDAIPGCLLRVPDGERTLLRKYRALEQELARVQRELSEEDSAVNRQMHALISKHATELRREEEKGYARGLQDGMKEGPAPNLAVVATIEELDVGGDPFAARIRFQFNPVPVGETLYWSHPEPVKS